MYHGTSLFKAPSVTAEGYLLSSTRSMIGVWWL